MAAAVAHDPAGGVAAGNTGFIPAVLEDRIAEDPANQAAKALAPADRAGGVNAVEAAAVRIADDSARGIATG